MIDLLVFKRTHIIFANSTMRVMKAMNTPQSRHILSVKGNKIQNQMARSESEQLWNTPTLSLRSKTVYHNLSKQTITIQKDAQERFNVLTD